MKTPKDRLIAGAIAGLIAAFIQNIYGWITQAVGLTDRSFYQFAEIVLSSRIYPGTLGFITGLIAHLAVGVMLGIIFAYAIYLTSSHYIVLKGFGYGLITWFLLSGFGTIFRLPLFEDIPPGPALVTLIGALLYGFVLAYTLKLIDQKTGLL